MGKLPRGFIALVALLALAILLGCRLGDAFTSLRGGATVVAIAPTRTKTRVPALPSPTQVIPTAAPSDTLVPTEAPTPTSSPPPTASAVPTNTSIPPPTRTHAPTRIPLPTQTFTTVPTPAPTRCPDQYCAVFRRCVPDGNTVVEGYVYAGGQPVNGVAVRAALDPGAYPLIDDFKSGNDPINPGHLDSNPAHTGRYFLQIYAGQAKKGNWWVFAVDKPNGTIMISQAQLIQTDGAGCQHAYVDFVK